MLWLRYRGRVCNSKAVTLPSLVIKSIANSKENDIQLPSVSEHQISIHSSIHQPFHLPYAANLTNDHAEV